MDIGQFAVYQLKNIPENREIRFRPYKALQEMGARVRRECYERAYLGQMGRSDSPESIRERFDRQLPRTFKGHSISVSDVLVLNKEGVVTSYYVEKNGFTVITGFFHNNASGAIVSLDTVDFHLEGKKGSWRTIDSVIVNGEEFFLMEHEKYGEEAAWVVVDADGKLIMDHVCHGFDQTVLRQLENWQKHMENGEYLRGSEIDEEQNYNMIDGRKNNMLPKGKNHRESVLAKLRRKQNELAKRSGGARGEDGSGCRQGI